jgi:hypothetical protein
MGNTCFCFEREIIHMSNIETLERMCLAGIMFLAGIVLLVFFLKRLLAWMDKRGWITYTGNVPTYHTLGNAFLELQSLAQPEKQYVIQMKEQRKQKREEDDAGGPDKSGSHADAPEGEP